MSTPTPETHVNAVRARLGLPPYAETRDAPEPERYEMAGTVKHETGAMHASAIRAAALAAAVAIYAPVAERVSVDRRQLLDMAAALAIYIETGERPA